MVLIREAEEEDALELDIRKLRADLRRSAGLMTEMEARFLVDAYYQMQQDRIRAANQVRTMGDEPHEILRWLGTQTWTLEQTVKAALDAYGDSKPLGRWAKSIVGIGPVLSAGLLCHIDITRAPTVGHIWSFAGLNPEARWEKGERRPWNARLKVICWKIGQSFVKVSGNPRDIYGHVWRERKDLEMLHNEAGMYADQAKVRLTKKIGKDTVAYANYAAGKLPPAHIEARAERYTVKLFLAHYHHVAYSLHYGQPPPRPYILTHSDEHAHYIGPPNWPMPDGEGAPPKPPRITEEAPPVLGTAAPFGFA